MWRRLPSVPKVRMAVLQQRRSERTRNGARRPGTSRPGPEARAGRVSEEARAPSPGSLLRRRRCGSPGHVAAADV
jgi:hypothetical protein